MNKTTTITILFILVFLISAQAVSQVKSSAMQTVTFAVIHTANHTLNTLAKVQESNSISNQENTRIFQNSLENIRVKVTVSETAETKSSSIDNHVDVRTLLQDKESAVINEKSTLVTVTE
ncbi:MAG: hypothetical protein JXA06_09685 [Bacteroidetes bacterium]|nr:hypothetical protein [Bacteroidota bacterium]